MAVNEADIKELKIVDALTTLLKSISLINQRVYFYHPMPIDGNNTPCINIRIGSEEETRATSSTYDFHTVPVPFYIDVVAKGQNAMRTAILLKYQIFEIIKNEISNPTNLAALCSSIVRGDTIYGDIDHLGNKYGELSVILLIKYRTKAWSEN